MVKEILTRWPVVRQLLTHSDGTGAEAMSDRTRNLAPKHRDAQVSRSVCPYCAVGCGQVVYHKDGKLVSTEGAPDSFISRGRLCPKGSDSFELLTHANRETRIKYRRPYSTRWECRGVISPNLIPVGGDPLSGAPVYDPLPTGGVRASQLFQAGIQFKLPIQNKVAEADLGADRAQLQQERLRMMQMEAQAAAEIRNAVIGWNAAKQAAQAATNARYLQEQLLSAEVEKFRAGFSTNFAVIQQQAYLAQAETTEIAAQATWKKASVQLVSFLWRDDIRQLGRRGLSKRPRSRVDFHSGSH